MLTDLQLFDRANWSARFPTPAQGNGRFRSAPAELGEAPALPSPAIDFRYQPRFLDLVNQLISSKPAGESYSIGICPVRGEDSIGRFVTFLGALVSQWSSAPVLVIETDFQRPCLARYLGASAAPGLREMIAPPPLNRFDCIHPTRYPNLHLLPAGSLGTGRAPQNIQTGLKWTLSVAKKYFQSVIIAFPAWNQHPGIHSSYALADAVLLAVPPDCCRAVTIRGTVQDLRKAKAKLVGAVLSDLE